jgi:hypothetical protein
MTPIEIIITAGTGTVFLFLLVAVLYLHVRVSRLLKGKDAKTLEDSWNSMSKDIEKLEAFSKKAQEYFKTVEKRVSRSAQVIETIRFNAFKGDGLGGNQSFATTVLNEHGDGVVISSISSRERTSVFAKPVKGFVSTIELSDEERRAIETSKEKLL